MSGPLSALPEFASGFAFADPCSAMVDCVRGLREAVSSGRPLPERLEAVAEAAAGLARPSFRLSECCRLSGDGPYGRNLVYRDADYGFVLIAMIWPAGCDAPIHDHGTWCAVAVLEGRVKIARYGLAERGSDRLTELGECEVAVAATCTVRPPETDIHKVWNPFDEPALTLHVYGKDITSCRVYDLAGGCETHEELGYANV